jgi:hypothetical protein
MKCITVLLTTLILPTLALANPDTYSVTCKLRLLREDGSIISEKPETYHCKSDHFLPKQSYECDNIIWHYSLPGQSIKHKIWLVQKANGLYLTLIEGANDYWKAGSSVRFVDIYETFKREKTIIFDLAENEITPAYEGYDVVCSLDTDRTIKN